MNKEFLEDHINLLIQDIEKHPILYNCDRKHFDLQQKQHLWSKLSLKYNINAKRRYKSLRDRYVREKKKFDEQLLISKAVDYPTWEYFSNLTFLNKYLRKKCDIKEINALGLDHSSINHDSDQDYKKDIKHQQDQNTINNSAEHKIEYEYNNNTDLENINSCDFKINNDDIDVRQKLVEEINMENKCGQIYLEKGKFIFLCDFCEQIFNNINIYMEHILNDHKSEEPNINYLIDDNMHTYTSFHKTNEIKDLYKEDTSNYYKTNSQVDDPLNESTLIYEIEYFDENNGNNNNSTIASECNNDNYNMQHNPRKSVINYDKPPKLLNENNLYPCTQCDKKYIVYKSLCDHFRIRHASTCKYCFIKFRNLHSLQAHLNEEHPGNQHKSIELNDELIELNEKSTEYNKNDEIEYDINFLTKQPQNEISVPLLVDEPVRMKNNEGRFICTLCDVTYTRYESIRRHYRFVHLYIAKSKYYCNQCNKNYNTKFYLRAHMNVHKGLRPFKCDLCKADFTHRNYLKSHRLIHLAEKPHPCSYCDKRFLRHYERMNHERASHTNERPYQCDDCGERFVRNSQLKQHKITKHENNPKYSCDQCDKKYHSRFQLRAHLNIHKGLRPYKCHLCSADFTHPQYLSFHIRIHLNGKRYPCTYCGKKFIRSYERICHERSNHTNEKLYQCDDCGKRFIKNSQLTCHKNLKHNPNYVRPLYECDICKNKFTRKESMQKHRLIHEGKKPFDCDICGSKFRTQHDVNVHKKIHSDIKNYVCKICDKRFAQGPGLYSHMKSHGIALSSKKDSDVLL